MVTVQRTEVRRITAIDLDDALCAGTGGAKAGSASAAASTTGVGRGTGAKVGPGGGEGGLREDEEGAGVGDSEQMVVCKEEEEYVLRITDSHATLFPVGAPGSEFALVAGDGRKGLGVMKAEDAKEKGKKGAKEVEKEAKGKAMAARCVPALNVSTPCMFS
jgi:hypothetical protein